MSSGSCSTFFCVSRVELAFALPTASMPTAAPFCKACVSLPLSKLSIFLFPSKYASRSSVTPVPSPLGPAYIQSTRFVATLPPFASCSFCSSSICRSSSRSLRSFSMSLRSSKAFCSSFHTRSWFLIRPVCQLFLALRSPPPMALCSVRYVLYEVKSRVMADRYPPPKAQPPTPRPSHLNLYLRSTSAPKVSQTWRYLKA